MKLEIVPSQRVKLVEEPGHEKDWGTPQAFLDVLYRFSPLELDPCSNSMSIVSSKERWTFTERYRADGQVETKTALDTLQDPWPKRGLVYCNPPYGKDSDPFMAKMAQEGREGCEIVALVPARVDTARWHLHAEKADVILFWRGRISFINPKTGKIQTGTKFPSAVLYWGKNVERFIETFSPYGSARMLPKI